MIFLDTNVVVAYLNGYEQVVQSVMEHLEKIALSTIVISELDYGAKASKNCKSNLITLYRFVDLVRVFPFDLAAAEQLGTIKSKLRSIGKPTGEVDAMIAAIAISHKAELITGNTRHFKNIEGLKLSCWQ